MKLKVKGLKGIIQFAREIKTKKVKVKGLTQPVIFHTVPEDLKNIIFNSYTELLKSVFNLEDFSWHSSPPTQGLIHTFENKDFEPLFDYEIYQKDEAYGNWFIPPSSFNWYDIIKVRIRPFVNPALRGSDAGYITVKCLTCNTTINTIQLINMHQEYFLEQVSISNIFDNHRNHLIQVETRVKGYKNHIDKTYQLTPFFQFSNNSGFWINEYFSAMVDSGGWATTAEIIVTSNHASYSVSSTTNASMQRYLAMIDDPSLSGSSSNNAEWSNTYTVRFKLSRGSYTKEYTAQATVKSHDRFSLAKTEYHLTEYPATVQNAVLNWTPPAWGNENVLTIPDCVINEGTYEPTKTANIQVKFNHQNTNLLTISRTRSIVQRKTAKYNCTETIISNNIVDTKDISGLKISYYVPLVIDSSRTKGFIATQSGNSIEVHYIDSEISINNPLPSSITFNTHKISTLSTNQQWIKGVSFGWGSYSSVLPLAFFFNNHFPCVTEYVVFPAKGINFKYIRGGTKYTVSVPVPDLHSSTPFEPLHQTAVVVAYKGGSYNEHILVFVPYKNTSGNMKTLIIMINNNTTACYTDYNSGSSGFVLNNKAPAEFHDAGFGYLVRMKEFYFGAGIHYAFGLTLSSSHFANINIITQNQIRNFYYDHYDFDSVRRTTGLSVINTSKFVGYLTDKLYILVKETVSRGDFVYGSHSHFSVTAPSSGNTTEDIFIPAVNSVSVQSSAITSNDSISFNYESYF